MKIKYLTIALSVLSLVLYPSCSDDEHAPDTPVVPDEPEEVSVPVKFSVSINPLTRSFIDNSYFDANTSIGVSLMYVNGEDYGENNKNREYKSSGTGSSQTWSANSDLTVGPRSCYAVAAYPYNGENSDLTEFPVSIDGNIDYMYGTASHVSSQNPNAFIVMRHAMSGIIVRFTKSADYAGTEAVSNISVSSTSLGTQGVLNALTGNISNIQNTGSSIAFKESFSSISTEIGGTQTEAIAVVPDVTGKVEISLKLKIGNVENTINVVQDTYFEMGKIYALDVQFRPGELVVTGLSVYDWGSSGNMSGFLKPA